MSAIASIFMPDQELDDPGQFGHDRRAGVLAPPPFALPIARAEKKQTVLACLEMRMTPTEVVRVSDCGVAAGV